MLKRAIIAILVIATVVVPSAGVLSADESTPNIVISEVLSNAENEDTDEFIELYNGGAGNVDLDGWQFTDGDSLDTIEAWDDGAFGSLSDPDAQTGSSTLEPGKYAVILDREYPAGSQPYNFGESTLILTCGNTTLGNELTASDPVTLFDSNLEVISTYGTPSMEEIPTDMDDDGLDGIPFDPGEGISVERIDLDGVDEESNWAANADDSSTPGSDNNPFFNAPPELESLSVNPSEISLDGQTEINIEIIVSDPNGVEDINRVELDLIELNAGIQELTTEDGQLEYAFIPDQSLSEGNYQITANVFDQAELNDSIEVQIALVNPSYSNKIVINEILPNPEGSDTEGEFIELYNLSNNEIDLSGWSVKDKAGTTYAIENSLSAKSFLALYRNLTNISINNSSESLYLVQPNGNILQTVSFDESAGEGESFSRKDNGQFVWTTTPTPGKTNKFTADEEESSSGASAQSSTSGSNGQSAKEEIECVTVEKAKSLEKGSDVCVTGVATVDPRVLSNSYMYIQDSTGGIQIYSSKGEFGDVKMGDEVKYTGETSEAYGEKKVNLNDESEIEVLASGKMVDLTTIKTKEAENNVGKLAITTGNITRQSGNTFYIDDGSGELKISINDNTGIEKPTYTKGDEVKLAGIIGRTTSGPRLMPRYQQDMEGGEVLGATTLEELPKAGANTIAFTLATLAVVSGYSLYVIKQQKRR